jgi:hypothetical protein
VEIVNSPAAARGLFCETSSGDLPQICAVEGDNAFSFAVNAELWWRKFIDQPIVIP